MNVAILHYSASPVIGGVEAVMDAHAAVLMANGYDVTVIAGRGEQQAFPKSARFISVPLADTQHPRILALSTELEQGRVPDDFAVVADELARTLRPLLAQFDHVIVHNVFSKHFNLSLTAALVRLLDENAIGHCLNWCHDISWTSPNSRSKVHAGYPWDLLRTYRKDLDYVVVSQSRQHELAALFQCAQEAIRIVYNGVDPNTLLGLSPIAGELAERLELFRSDLNILMPVRVTRAKNIEFALEIVHALKAGGLSPRLVITGPPDPHDSVSMVFFRQLQALRADFELDDEVRFVFESGPDPHEPYYIGVEIVGELLRLSDIMLMPSHREGFGMPILEAGLAGVAIVASSQVPAALEIGGEDIVIIDPDDRAEDVASQILSLADKPHQRLRQRVRQHYTWQAIFERDMKPLLSKP